MLVLGCAPPALASGGSGTAIFSKRFGKAGTDRSVAVSVDDAGLIAIAGWADGGVDLGSGVTVGMATEVSERLIFLAKLDARGNALWGHTTDRHEAIPLVAMAVDRGGYISYAFQGYTTNEASLQRIDPSGRQVWQKWLTGDGSLVSEIRINAAGNTLIAGYINPWRARPLDLGSGPITCGGQSTCGLVAEFDPQGKPLWSQTFPARLSSIDTNATGDIVVGGCLGTASGRCNAYLARLDRGGNVLWTRTYGESKRQEISRVAMTPDGSAIILGFFRGTFDLGGGAPLESGDTDRFFVAKIDPSGVTRWSRRFGGDVIDRRLALAVDRGGGVIAAGAFEGKFDLDCGALSSRGTKDMFVASFTADGRPRWSRRYGEAGGVQPWAMAMGAHGEIVVTGEFTGTVDFGNGPLVSAGREDGFLVALTP